MKKSIRMLLLLLFFADQMALSQWQGYGETVPVPVKQRKRDQSNKVYYEDWQNVETLLVDSVHGFKPGNAVSVNKYGGDSRRKIAGPGFFRVVNQSGRWTGVDPLGNPYLNLAVNSINRGKSDRNIEAFAKKFGSTNRWMDSTVSLLHRNGFNSSGSWSETEAITEYNKRNPEKPLVYTINWNFMSSYGSKRGGTYRVPGHLAYPGNAIFVFDPQFETFCDELAKQLVKYKNDKNLFGYFSDNEMPFSVNNLQGYLSLPATDPGHVAARKWLHDNGIDENEITEQHKRQFLAFTAERYFSIVSSAIKKYDPNHMYLGCRFYSGEKNVPEFMQAAGKFLDIISINYYGAWTASQETMNNWGKWSGRPFIITEYYVKAEDSGLPNISGAGWIVKSQDDRGRFYENFCMSLLRSPYCVGWHWFKYQDNDPFQKDAEPSNIDANKGIVDNLYQPYQPLLTRMKKLNLNSYTLRQHFDTIDKPDSTFDLYLLIGQSNMAGRGPITEEYAGVKNPFILKLNKQHQWVPAEHPLHFDKPKAAGVGPGLSFAIEMNKLNPQHKIGLVPCAVGGTMIDKWKPGAFDSATKTYPYDDMLKRLREASKKGVFRGILWHQGEGDSNPQRSVTYLEKLKELIALVRTEIGNNSIPLVVGELGHYKQQYTLINNELKKVPATIPYAALASSLGLDHKGDTTHFSSASAELLGRRFAEKMKALQSPTVGK